jgi:hypothetical protein
VKKDMDRTVVNDGLIFMGFNGIWWDLMGCNTFR